MLFKSNIMILNKKLFAYFLLSAFTFISACDINPLCNPDPEILKLSALAYQTQAADVDFNSSGFLTIDNNVELNEGDSVPFDSYTIQVVSELDFVFSDPITSPRSQLLPSAYACSPVQIIVDRIDSIKVYSLMDYSPGFLAGNECTELFSFSCFAGDEICNFKAIPLNELNDNGTKVPFRFNLFLSHPPAQDGMYSFRVECYISGEGIGLSTHETKAVFISD